MTHIGLFDGIGGFSYAASKTGFETIAWCEIDPLCRTVLGYHFPNADKIGDIKNADFTIYRGKCDVLTGGFPCQPYSVAGKRLGKADERHLFPEMLRAIREIQPNWVVGENVSGLLSWNGGLVFDEVCVDLENEGYEVQSFVIPACAVNAPHRRDRVWIIAQNTNFIRQRCGERKEELLFGQFGIIGAGDNERVSTDYTEIGTTTNTDGEGLEGARRARLQTHQQRAGAEIFTRISEKQPSTDTESSHDRRHFGESEGGQESEFGIGAFSKTFDNSNGERLEQQSADRELERQRPCKSGGNRDERWANFPTESPIRGGNDGIPEKLDAITVSEWRRETIKAYGNAIVPQVAIQIFNAIKSC